MRILLVKPGESCETVEVENKLETLQKIVGGYIEAVALNEKTTLVCNEEGKVNGSMPNRIVRSKWLRDIIYGTFFLCGINKDDFGDIDYEEEKEWRKIFG